MLFLSFLAAAVVIGLTVLNFTIFRDNNSAAQSVLTCVVGLLIPVIGWVGAKESNRSLVGMFCAFSFSCGLFNLISYCVVMWSISAMRSIISDCAPDGTVIVDGEVNTTYCSDYTDDSLRDMSIIATCVSIPVIFLQCIGAFYGNKLYTTLTPGVIITYGTDPYPRGGFGEPRIYGVGIVTAPSPVIYQADAVVVDSPKKPNV